MANLWMSAIPRIALVETLDETMHSWATFTIADTENLSLTINQNDVTNNPAGIVITNTWSWNDITAPNFSLINWVVTTTTFSWDLNWTINTATTWATQSASDNSTKIATTAYVDAAVPSLTNHNDLPWLNWWASSEYYHLTLAQHAIATQAANTTVSGYLSTTDWNTFNGKSPAVGSSSIVTTWALNAWSITSWFTSINVGTWSINWWTITWKKLIIAQTIDLSTAFEVSNSWNYWSWYITRSAAWSSVTRSVFYIESQNAADTAPTLRLVNGWVGDWILIDKNNYWNGINIDMDANSASAMYWIKIAVDNAWAWLEYAFDFDSSSLERAIGSCSTTKYIRVQDSGWNEYTIEMKSVA